MNTSQNVNGIMKKKKPIKEIYMKVIPHKEQRYKTVGDYWIDKHGVLQIRTSDFSDNRMSMLVLIHELIEVLLTEHRDIKEEDISGFDIEFEKKRKKNNTDEPGDDKNAPYRAEHCIATSVERLMAALLNVPWVDYDKSCNVL